MKIKKQKIKNTDKIKTYKIKDKIIKSNKYKIKNEQ